MKIVFIGTVEFSKHALLKLIDLKADITGVITQKTSSLNADFWDLSDIAKGNNIPCKYITNINSDENIGWIKKLKPDIIFCFGLSQILKKQILNIAPMGVVGYHPAELPYNRNRHPIVWALVLGLKKTASTFFFMDEGPDSGDILSQAEVIITYEDNARTLYDSLTNAALRQIEEFLPKLENGTFNRLPQGHSKANYWRKRVSEDGRIDFKMSSRAIYNLVRALAKPYVGAHIAYDNKEIKIWEAKEARVDLPNIEYGKVLDIKDNQVLVKCYDDAILLTKHEFEKLPNIGDYFL